MKKHLLSKKLSVIITLLLFGFQMKSQNCIQPAQFGSATIAQTGTTNVTTCAFAGEYSLLTFTTAGTYTVFSTGGIGNYITVTDNSNVPVISGPSPLVVNIALTGTYRAHISTNASCGTESACRTISVARVLPTCTQPTPFGNATVAQTGTTTITTCAFAGEYSTGNFTTAAVYTINVTGGTGNYLTITDNSNNVLTTGFSPLSVAIPSVGLYRIHISTNTSCGTENTCRTVAVIRNLTPCIHATAFGNATVSLTGTTNVTGCAFAGEYATGTFTSTGSYTVNSTGGTGNFITITNTANVVLLSGNAPLAVTIPSVGAYRFHISTNSSCGTDAVCHTVSVIGITPPPNDNCTNATTLAIPSSSAGTTFNASLETNSPGSCSNVLNQPGVWYTVVGNGNRFGANLGCSSGWDSKIFVYSGNCGTLTCITSNDDNGPLCTGSAASATWCTVPTTTYYILVTGYSTPNNFTISISETAVPSVTITPAAPSVCLGNSVTLTASGGSTYTWTAGPNNSTYTVSPSTSTIYTVSATTTVGCIRTQTTSVTVNPNPTISVNSGTICAGESFTINPSGAQTYTIEGGNSIVNPNSNATYTVIGTDALGCVSQNPATSTINVNASPIISVNSGAICEGQSFTITPGGANTYTIEGGNAVVTPSANTSYTVIGTSSLGCVSQSAAVSNVTVNPNPVISVNSGVVCQGQSFTISPSGAATYTIEGGNAVVTPTTSTNYTVIGTSAAGCVSQSVAISSITVNASPVVSVNSGTICAGNSFTIIPSGANTYTVQGGNFVVNPSTSSSYTLIGESAQGCLSSNTATANLTVNPLPVVSITGQSLVCQGQTAVLTASGANTYSWNTTATTASLMVAPSATSVYVVSGTNSLTGCSNTASFSITVDPCTGINAINKSSAQVSIYPNPNKGEFIIESANGLNKTIVVMDLTGKLLLTLNSELDKTPVNINEFDNGVYMIRVSSENNSQTYRLIKQ